MELVAVTDSVFSLATLVALVTLGVVTVVSIFHRNFRYQLLRFVQQKTAQLVFVVSFVAMLGSLWYSGVLGYEPCLLCWWQRIFLFPLVPLSLAVLVDRTTRPHLYLLPRAAIGFFVSLYQYMTQIGVLTEGEACSSEVLGGSCSSRLVFEFGFITIPFMALLTFAVILSVLIVHFVTTSRS